MSDRRARALTGWRRWRDLPPRDRRLAAALVVILPAVAAGLHVLGFGRLCRLLSRLTLASRDRSTGIPNRGLPSHAFPVSPASTSAAETGRALGRLVNAVAWRLPGRPACLTRSVTLWWLLRRRGIDSEIRIGVRRADGRLEAHAWVELEGVVLNDAQDVGERFAAFEGETLPASWAGQ